MADYERSTASAANIVCRSIEPALERLAKILRAAKRQAAADKTADGELRDAATCLLVVHEWQWELEAACRAVGVSDVELGRLKREIDESNSRRVAYINDIDSMVSEYVPSTQAGTLPWPLTIGQMVDNLLIAGLKAHKLNPSRPDAAEIFAHVQKSFENLVALVAAGSVALPPASTIKDYLNHHGWRPTPPMGQ